MLIETGWAFRVVGLHQAIQKTTVGASVVSHPLSLKEDSRADAGPGRVFSAGLRYRAGGVALAPEVRYTRWGSSENLLGKNEAAFLLGVRF